MGAAVTVMDAFYPRLAHAVFDPWLDPTQFAQLASIMNLNDPPGPAARRTTAAGRATYSDPCGRR